MKILLNSIAVEPNRWTAEKIPHYSLKDLLNPVRRAGFNALEVWQNHFALLDNAGIKELVKVADEEDVEFPVAGLYPVLHLGGSEGEAEKQRIISIADRAADLGAVMLKMMPGQVPSAQLQPALRENTLRFLDDIFEHTQRHAFTITLETHAGTLADDAGYLLSFLNAVGSSRLKVCWQPLDFKDTAAAIELYEMLSGHIVHLHLQGRKDGNMELLENSDIDYRAVLKHMADRGFDGYASIEFVKDCVAESPERFDLSRVLSNAERDRIFAARFFNS